MTLTCTALVRDERCGALNVVRDFCSSLYPDGPAIRLCPRHEAAFHRTVINAIHLGEGSLPMEDYEQMCDDWRYAIDCA